MKRQSEESINWEKCRRISRRGLCDLTVSSNALSSLDLLPRHEIVLVFIFDRLQFDWLHNFFVAVVAAAAWRVESSKRISWRKMLLNELQRQGVVQGWSLSKLKSERELWLATSNYRKLERHITWFTVDLTHTDALSVLSSSLAVCLCCILSFIFWVFYSNVWLSCNVNFISSPQQLPNSIFSQHQQCFESLQRFFFGDNLLQNDTLLLFIFVLPPLLMIYRLFQQLTRLNVSVLSVTSILVSHCLSQFLIA